MIHENARVLSFCCESGFFWRWFFFVSPFPGASVIVEICGVSQNIELYCSKIAISL